MKDLNHSGGSTTMGSLNASAYHCRTSRSCREQIFNTWHKTRSTDNWNLTLDWHLPAEGTRVQAAGLVNQWILWLEYERRNKWKRWFLTHAEPWCVTHTDPRHAEEKPGDKVRVVACCGNACSQDGSYWLAEGERGRSSWHHHMQVQ